MAASEGTRLRFGGGWAIVMAMPSVVVIAFHLLAGMGIPRLSAFSRESGVAATDGPSHRGP